MTKYYWFGNAGRRLKVGKITLSFEVVDQFAGTWRGVLKTEDPVVIAAAENETVKQLGVREITEEEYLQWQKKKNNWKSPSPDTPLPLESRITVPPAGPAVIKNPSSPTTPKEVDNPATAQLTVQEAVLVGEAPYIDPLEKRSGKKRVKKTEL